MALQEEIFSIQEYFRSIEYFGKGIVVKVELPPKWSVYPSQDGKIKVTPDENIPNMYFYYTDLNEGTLEGIFSLIRETVDMNLSVIKKITLMKEKIEELKELFASKPIDELVNLKFTFEEEKKKRKYTKKKKEEEPKPSKEEKEITVTEEENKVDDNE